MHRLSQTILSVTVLALALMTLQGCAGKRYFFSFVSQAQSFWVDDCLFQYEPQTHSATLILEDPKSQKKMGNIHLKTPSAIPLKEIQPGTPLELDLSQESWIIALRDEEESKWTLESGRFLLQTVTSELVQLSFEAKVAPPYQRSFVGSCNARL